MLQPKKLSPDCMGTKTSPHRDGANGPHLVVRVSLVDDHPIILTVAVNPTGCVRWGRAQGQLEELVQLGLNMEKSDISTSSIS